MSKTDTPAFDVKSAAPVLFYVGPGFTEGVPADDLSANALARLAWIRQGPSRPDRPDDVPQAAIAAIRDELIATGKYQMKPPEE